MAISNHFFIVLILLLAHHAHAAPSGPRKASNAKHGLKPKHKIPFKKLPDLHDKQKVSIWMKVPSMRQSSTMGINIVAGATVAESRAHAYGSEAHTITDTERATFGIGDHGLKKAVGAYKGKEPTDAFVRSPTPWNDLYSRYGWAQVKTTLVPVSTQILSINTQPTTVKTTTFSNPSSQSGDFDVAISESVRNIVTSSWTSSTTVSFEQKIKYNIEAFGTGGGGETSFGFEQQFGVGGSHAKWVEVGTSSGVKVTLEPGETVQAVLRASRGSMRVKVTYRATLSGYVACNYYPRFQDHHFWAYGVNSVLSAGQLAREKYITEIIDIGYYSDSSVELRDPAAL